jgi:tetratricopeptide (TPR) repeat protein
MGPVALMRLRLSIPVMSVAVFLGPHLLRSAPSRQSQSNARDQEILQIQQLIQEHDLQKARLEIAKAANQYPADAGFDNLLGIVEAQQGDYIAAEKSLRRAITRDPKFTGAYLNLGRLYQENAAADPQAVRKAIEVYGRVLEYDTANSEALYQSAALLLRQGRYQESLNYVSRLPAQDQTSAQTLSIRCADYAGLSNGKGADDAAAQLMGAADFSEPDAQQALLGLTPAKRDDLIVALLENLQERQPLGSVSLKSLGLAYEHLNRLVEARAALEKSFANGKPKVASLLELARVARLQKDYPGALGYLAHARDLEPGNASLHYYFGLVCVDLNLIAEARDSFAKAVEREPENADYNYAMGAASAFRQDPAEAVPYFEKYLKLKPRDPRGKLALGAALFRAKDYEHALPWLKQSLGSSQTATRAHYYLGAIALEEDRLDEAFVELQQALKAMPDFPDALAELGRWYLNRKDYRQAEKQIQLALKIEPDHYAANFYLLMLYTRTKDAKQETQAKRFDELKKLLAEKNQEFLRIVEVRPFETP